MRRQIYLQTILLVICCAVAAAAHPLGNFSVNQFARLEIENNEIKLRAVLDLAEIPSFQEARAIDADKNGALSADELNSFAEQITPAYVENLKLSIDGVPAAVRVLSKQAFVNRGEANLPILRVEWNLAAAVPPSEQNARRVAFENKNHAGRIGWNEIVVHQSSGVKVFDSTAYGSSLTDEIKNYPEDLLNAPLAERAAEFSVSTGAIPPNSKPLKNRDGKISEAKQKDSLAALIAVPEITPAIALVGLLIAFALGAAHALSPGHGKAVVGAYLVGSKGTPKHAVFLGLTVTVTHTLGVFALGLITIFAQNFILPERILPFLNFVSGLLVFFIGVSLFKDRLFKSLGWTIENHRHDHAHDEHASGADWHSHDGVNFHSHAPPEKVTWRNLLALGISGGLLPCPSALVLMLSAISLNRAGYGLILTTAFSFGLAATLTAVGLIFLSAGKFFERRGLAENRIVQTLPVFSALFIACIGALMCYNSLA